MHCRTFRDEHAAFVDGVLGESDLAAAHAHLTECARCAAHDASVRRALLLFRNMPSIEPSADFLTRLHARLRETPSLSAASRVRPWAMSGLAVAAALVVAVGTLAMRARHTPEPPLALTPVSVLASSESDSIALAHSPASPLTSPMIVTSVSTGMPMWSAAFLAQQAPVRFAASAFKLVSLGQ